MIFQLLHSLGIDDTTGPWYAFWSGFGGDLLQALPLAAGVFLWYHHNKCHRCMLLGKHVPNYHWPYCVFHRPVKAEDSKAAG